MTLSHPCWYPRIWLSYHASRKWEKVLSWRRRCSLLASWRRRSRRRLSALAQNPAPKPRTQPRDRALATQLCIPAKGWRMKGGFEAEMSGMWKRERNVSSEDSFVGPTGVHINPYCWAGNWGTRHDERPSTWQWRNELMAQFRGRVIMTTFSSALPFTF